MDRSLLTSPSCSSTKIIIIHVIHNEKLILTCLYSNDDKNILKGQYEDVAYQ